MADEKKAEKGKEKKGKVRFTPQGDIPTPENKEARKAKGKAQREEFLKKREARRVKKAPKPDK
jgi:hypothetical protein